MEEEKSEGQTTPPPKPTVSSPSPPPSSTFGGGGGPNQGTVGSSIAEGPRSFCYTNQENVPGYRFFQNRLEAHLYVDEILSKCDSDTGVVIAGFRVRENNALGEPRPGLINWTPSVSPYPPQSNAQPGNSQVLLSTVPGAAAADAGDRMGFVESESSSSFGTQWPSMFPGSSSAAPISGFPQCYCPVCCPQITPTPVINCCWCNGEVCKNLPLL